MENIIPVFSHVPNTSRSIPLAESKSCQLLVTESDGLAVILRQDHDCSRPIPYRAKDLCRIEFKEDADTLNSKVKKVFVNPGSGQAILLLHETRSGQFIPVRAVVDGLHFCQLQAEGCVAELSFSPFLTPFEWTEFENDWSFQVDVNFDTRIVRTSREVDDLLSELHRKNSFLLTTTRYNSDIIFMVVSGNNATIEHHPEPGSPSLYQTERSQVGGVVEFVVEELDEHSEVDACDVIPKDAAMNVLQQYLSSGLKST